MLKEKYGYTKLFMIGDGITDLEASPPADAFIGKFPSYYIFSANIENGQIFHSLFFQLKIDFSNIYYYYFIVSIIL